MLSISEVILKNLINNSEYTARVLPYIKAEYFERTEEKILFSQISKFIERYNENPTVESLYVALGEVKGLNESQAEVIDEIIKSIKESPEVSQLDWLVTNTEKFCNDRAIYNAITEAILITEGKSKLVYGQIPDLMREACSISFDVSLGHDYLEDAEERYEYYHKLENKVPFNLDILNKITKNGFTKKTLSLFMAGPHVGKSAFMCHQAAGNLRDGRNVLYFTMEMAQEEISKRIDANLMNITMDEVDTITKDLFMKKIGSIKSKTIGKLIVKEYGMGSAHVGHFRAFLNELKLKQGFIPEIIYVDYLNIVASQRFAGNSNINSYGMMKAVSEELRSLASEFNVVMVSATQVNRGGHGASNPTMSDIAESFGVNFGVDFLAALIVDDDMKEEGTVSVIQLKNRFDNMDKIPRFFIGFDRNKMKFYDMDDPTENVVDTAPAPMITDKSSVTDRIRAEQAKNKQTKKKGFKFD